MVKLSPNVVCRPTSPTGRSLQKTEQEFTARILQESTAAIPSPENGKCDPPKNKNKIIFFFFLHFYIGLLSITFILFGANKEKFVDMSNVT